jgi:predicted amidohydrolase
MRYLQLFAFVLVSFLSLGCGAQDSTTAHDRGPRQSLPRKVIIGTVIQPFWQFTTQEARLDEVTSSIDRIAQASEEKYPQQGLDFVVLPEEIMTLGGNRSPAERALDRNGPEMERLRDKAREYNTYIVVPLTLADDRANGIYSNAAILLDRKGADVGVYRKYHPVAPHGSDILEGGITPGTEFPVFDCDFGRVGIQICWDMAFEDGWTELARKGAEIVALPTASPQTARPSSYALHGGYFVVSSAPRDNASVFSPIGKIVAQAKGSGVLVHQLDLSYALLHWSPTLKNGQAFTEKYGARAGYVYFAEEDTGIFWSNDPQLPIKRMVEELGEIELEAQVERTRALQDAARPSKSDEHG